MKFSADLWNRTVPPLARETPLAGRNVRLARTSRGTIVSANGRFGWLHPWSVRAFWDEKQSRWLASVKPGFVNGLDPSIDGVPLLDLEPGQGMALHFGEIDSKPPKFFSDLGVRDPSGGGFSVTAAGGARVVDTSWQDAFRPPPRRLWSCDIQLSQARMGMAGDVRIEDATGTSGRVASYYPRPLTSLIETRGDRPVLQSLPRFVPQRKPDLMDRLLGAWEDPQEDILHIARVWMLSPPDWPAEAGGPDASWTPFPQHFVFWNLGHGARIPQTPGAFQPITMFTGLAGGIGDSIGNQILAPLNDATPRVQAAMGTVTPEGRFWTV